MIKLAKCGSNMEVQMLKKMTKVDEKSRCSREVRNKKASKCYVFKLILLVQRLK